MINAPLWKVYFDAQSAIRTRYNLKAKAVVEKYAALERDEPTTDVIVLFARQNQMYAELTALNEACEAELAKVEKPG